jgi:RNA polymerase sigma-70 factor (ECF subfamily)
VSDPAAAPTTTTPAISPSPARAAAAATEPHADAALVAASKRGDREAFEELVRRTARLVYARAYLETGDVHRAEDLVQETYLTAWRKIDQITDASGFRPWLMSILHSALIDSVRRASRKKRKRAGNSGASDEELFRLTDPSPTPAETAQTREERQRALSILRSLPREYQQVLMLRYLGGADYDTIARQLALSNGSLRGLLHRGLAMLRKQIEAK